MSVREYSYQTATKIDQCVRYCQNTLQLRDWHIDIEIGGNAPDWHDGTEAYGAVNFQKECLRATVWINEPKLKTDNKNPYATVIHEVIHIFFTAQRFKKDELATRILEPVIYRLFCKENKIRMAKERE